MAITTNAELNTAVANWLARSDLTSRIPEFIVCFEDRFNRTVRVPQQEKRNASFSITGEYVTVPTDFIELRAMHLTTDPKRPLRYMTPDQEVDSYNSGTGIPQFVSVTGHTTIDGTMSFRFAPVPDATYTAVLTYYAKLGAVASATNWLLTNHPSIYLHGAIAEALILIDDPRAAAMFALSESELASLNKHNRQAKWGASGMAVRPG